MEYKWHCALCLYDSCESCALEFKLIDDSQYFGACYTLHKSDKWNPSGGIEINVVEFMARMFVPQLPKPDNPLYKEHTEYIYID